MRIWANDSDLSQICRAICVDLHECQMPSGHLRMPAGAQQQHIHTHIYRIRRSFFSRARTSWGWAVNV